jgi:hypothetical protein
VSEAEIFGEAGFHKYRRRSGRRSLRRSQARVARSRRKRRMPIFASLVRGLMGEKKGLETVRPPVPILIHCDDRPS